MSQVKVPTRRPLRVGPASAVLRWRPLLVLLGSLVADLLYGVADPRIRTA